jgi:hypothetical protein
MGSLETKLVQYAENHLNVMLVGAHGIGKSTVVKAISEKLGLKFKYYSSSTLDPFAELIGIPVPDKENKTVDFYRPHDLDDAEFVFFDELNRVTNPRVLNTVLEIIQFKSINGNPLKNLKMVWAAINPPGEDYQVEELDPALIDRFHVYIKMKPTISMEYMKSVMSEDIAKVVKRWWDDDLSDDQRRVLTPRRIEYIGTMIDKEIPWKDAIPQGHAFPVGDLTKRLKVLKNPEEDYIIDKESILSRRDFFLQKLKDEPKHAIKISECMAKFDSDELFECRDLLENIPMELITNHIGSKFVQLRRQLKQQMIAAGIDPFQDYPKISKACKFENLK